MASLLPFELVALSIRQNDFTKSAMTWSARFQLPPPAARKQA